MALLTDIGIHRLRCTNIPKYYDQLNRASGTCFIAARRDSHLILRSVANSAKLRLLSQRIHQSQHHDPCEFIRKKTTQKWSEGLGLESKTSPWERDKNGLKCTT